MGEKAKVLYSSLKKLNTDQILTSINQLTKGNGKSPYTSWACDCVLKKKERTIPVTTTKVLILKYIKLAYKHRAGSPPHCWKQSHKHMGRHRYQTSKEENPQKVIIFCYGRGQQRWTQLSLLDSKPKNKQKTKNTPVFFNRNSPSPSTSALCILKVKQR